MNEKEVIQIETDNCHEKIIKILADNIRSLVKIGEEDCILVAGLGNTDITPDAIGPLSVSNIFATRHINLAGIEIEVPFLQYVKSK